MASLDREVTPGMRELELVGMSEDGVAVVFVESSSGENFAVRVDDRLRAAVVHDRVRLGQLELALASPLRPKEIQARIRAGQGVDEVAAAAGLPRERIVRFAGPVLAEREHVAGQAQRSSLRRPGGQLPMSLGEAVADRLNGRGVTTDLAWDAWRREDALWLVRLTYRSGERARSALFVYDPLSRVVTAGDDESRWLAGEPGPLHGPQPRSGQADRDPAPQAGRQTERRDDDPSGRVDLESEGRALRLAPIESADEADGLVGADELFDHPYHRSAVPVVEAGPEVEDEPEVEDAPAVEDDQPTASITPLTPEPVDEGADLDPDERTDLDGPAILDGPMGVDEPDQTVTSDAAPVTESGIQTEDAAAEEATSPRRRARRRAAVPSWDDILFGAKNDG